MDKILITLEVPSISAAYEMQVPGFLTIRELTTMFVRAVRELSGGLYHSSGAEFLCAKQQEILLDEDAVLANYDIGNGDHLILM